MRITLVSAGMGTGGTLTREAEEALGHADCVIGAERLLRDVPIPSGVHAVPIALPDEVVRFIRDNEYSSPVVVLSGDVGFYSGAKRIIELLGNGSDVDVIPGVSTVQYFASRLRRPWQDFHLVSAHGLETDVLGVVLNHPRVFFLTGGKLDVRTILSILQTARLGDAEVTVGSNLAGPDECIVRGTVRDLADRGFPPLSVMLVENAGAFARTSRACGIPDDAFIRADVPMTKREVRAVAMSLLAPEPADILYDIGAGTGSVSIEMANLARYGRVFAVEHKDEACRLVAENRDRFRIHNLDIIQGKAPEAIQGLPTPDRVFIGGSGGNMDAIVEEVVGKNPSVRIVAAAICLETVAEVMESFRRVRLSDIETVQIAASRARPVGGKHLLTAENPIFLLAAGGRP